MTRHALNLRGVAMRRVRRARAVFKAQAADRLANLYQNKAVLDAERRGEGEALLMPDGNFVLIAKAPEPIAHTPNTWHRAALDILYRWKFA